MVAQKIAIGQWVKRCVEQPTVSVARLFAKFRFTQFLILAPGRVPPDPARAVQVELFSAKSILVWILITGWDVAVWQYWISKVLFGLTPWVRRLEAFRMF